MSRFDEWESVFSGYGAAKVGGRWNSIGIPVVYCSENPSLCLLESLVHINALANMPAQSLFLIYVPDNSITTIEEPNLPKDWRNYPYSPGRSGSSSTQKIGDKFINSRQALGLRVPSAVMPCDYNIVINPAHDRFREVKLLDTFKYDLDKRLLQSAVAAPSQS